MEIGVEAKLRARPFAKRGRAVTEFVSIIYLTTQTAQLDTAWEI